MARDLACEIHADGLTKARAKELAAASPRHAPMRVTASRRRRRWVLEIPEAADLAAEAADVDRTTWEMARADCERLADTLDWLLAELPGELTFEVVRSDAAAAMEVVASRVELASAARRGAIGTRTRYRVLV